MINTNYVSKWFKFNRGGIRVYELDALRDLQPIERTNKLKLNSAKG